MTGSAHWRIRPVPEPGVYGAGVAAAVERMWRGEFSKVVLARTLELTSAAPLDLPGMLQRLARRDPAGHTFALPTGPGRTLIGASPELLVSRQGKQVIANPLAGSTPRSTDLAEDVRRAAALLESAKDLHEHAVVVDAVHQALAPHCTELTVPARPTLIRTATMWHLSTTVTGTLASPDISALTLACALHPTPAVCGTPPRRPAGSSRRPSPSTAATSPGWWAGATPGATASGSSRSAVPRPRNAHCGSTRAPQIVAASVPEAETAETAAKFRTFLSAVGAEL